MSSLGPIPGQAVPRDLLGSLEPGEFVEGNGPVQGNLSRVVVRVDGQDAGSLDSPASEQSGRQPHDGFVQSQTVKALLLMCLGKVSLQWQVEKSADCLHTFVCKRVPALETKSAAL